MLSYALDTNYICIKCGNLQLYYAIVHSNRMLFLEDLPRSGTGDQSVIYIVGRSSPFPIECEFIMFCIQTI